MPFCGTSLAHPYSLQDFFSVNRTLQVGKVNCSAVHLNDKTVTVYSITTHEATMFGSQAQ